MSVLAGGAVVVVAVEGSSSCASTIKRHKHAATQLCNDNCGDDFILMTLR